MTLEARDEISFDRTLTSAQRAKRMRRSAAFRFRGFLRALSSRFSSSLTRRIVVLNLGGLVALLLGFLYLNQFREGLIDARVQSLQTQGEIIAAAIAASATVETDSITIDPEKLLQLAPGESYALADEIVPSLEFSINPERVGPVLHRLASPTKTRARLYDRDGYMLLDSRSLTSRSNILRFDLPAAADQQAETLIDLLWNKLKALAGRPQLPLYDDAGAANGKSYLEVASALGGTARSIVRVNAKGETIVSVAAPIQRFRVVRGALLLSTQGGDIDEIITSERWALVRVFAVSAIIMFMLSLFIAGTIAEPIRRLAEAAERVRRGTKSRREIPDFTDRSDEIGHLSGALRDMTKALYDRIEAIESFAADVAHELKNPLTSLRSAVETLPIARKEESRQRLLDVIHHDVRRLDRLISDISDASRLDAELARADMEPVDLDRVLDAVVSMANQVGSDDGVRVSLAVIRHAPFDAGRQMTFRVLGHDSRIGQVFNNLIDNARSFSNRGGSVRVVVRAAKDYAPNGESRDGFEVIIDDDGPGIPADAFERIFERFYTDRPEQGFGQNSGLGLSISRQIIEAHGGRVTAINRIGPKGADGERPVLGARFMIWLPEAR
ncbi:stimulus-sensing domain-containing protein [Methylocapsa palsarum]|uniref:histidine kinase n=1 Tax=Methylocapsa palsarum TaxID=1612308 RepID=A0A1I3W239_9HYPH|nr:stimulus-sensing domain-containing protein [Methylocapsa palsarum]SFK00491.1 two-component system, OmpR family, sensor histidine kinase ChvG [Methylocapsa palsarum]